MKKILLLSAVSIALFTGCTNNREAENNVVVASVDTTLQFFGDTITQTDALPANQLSTKMKGKDSLKVKLTGTIEAVCQKKGCWLDMNIGDNKTMKVRFKDYKFFVPKDASGKTVTIEGIAYNDTTSVADLKHYAQDAGKSKEEIAKIDQPEINIGFEANGVIIKK